MHHIRVAQEINISRFKGSIQYLKAMLSTGFSKTTGIIDFELLGIQLNTLGTRIAAISITPDQDLAIPVQR